MSDPIPFRVATSGDASAAPADAVPVNLFGAGGPAVNIDALLKALPGWKAGTAQTLGHAANGAISWIDNP